VVLRGGAEISEPVKLPKVKAIVLSDTPGRTERLSEHLRDRGVDWEPFEGIDAKKWALTTTNTYEIDNPGEGHIIPQKHTGLALSHHILWMIQKELRLSELTIFEDDCILSEDWEERYTEGRKHLPGDWDILMIGSAHCQYRAKEHVSGPIWEVWWPITTHAYIVNYKALDTLLRTQRYSGAPIDIALCNRSYPLLQVYTLLPRIAEQHLTPLDE